VIFERSWIHRNNLVAKLRDAGSRVNRRIGGAATGIAPNHLYSVAKPDGLTFGIFNGNLISGHALSAKGLDFDVRHSNRSSSRCAISSNTPNRTMASGLPAAKSSQPGT
jgi:hypothetical protein